MSPPQATSCPKAESNSEKVAKNTPTALDEGAATGVSRASSSSMKVQEFMSYLAKEANIANMTVETKDGRRISATFEQGLPAGITPSNGSGLPPTENGNGVASNGNAPEKPSTQNGKIKKEDATVVEKVSSPTRDIAKTIALMSADQTKPSAPTEPLSSQEWAVNYQNKHVAVTYSSIAPIAPSLTNGSNHKSNGSSTLPPKKRAAKQEEGTPETSWNAMTALVDAATVAQREHIQLPPSSGTVDSTQLATALTMGVNAQAEAKKKPTKRKSRKIIPDVKVFVEFTQKDVLFGRGGRSNHHPGNKTYRDIVTNQQAHYRGCDKNEKTRVAQGIVDHIQNVVGGRFLELDRDVKRWFLVPNVVARRKVGQALRENNTEEARAAKRAKYQGRLTTKKKETPVAGGVNGSVPMITLGNTSSANGTLPLTGGGANPSNNSFPIPATTTTTNSNSFPMDDTESKNEVAV